MAELGPDAFATRLCKTIGCGNELTTADPTRGRYAGKCARCRADAGFAERQKHQRSIAAQADAVDAARLTDADLTLLLAVADGQFPVEIAAEYSLTRSAVTAHLNALKRKLGARTDAHLVALAYHRRILFAPPAR